MIITSFQRLSSRLALLGGWAAALILFSMLSLVIIEIVTRNIFSFSTHMMDELVSYGVGCSTLLALGYAFERHFLIRMELIIDAFNERKRRWIELINGFLTLIITILLAWRLSITVLSDYQRNNRSGTIIDVPLYIPKLIMLVGLIIFSFTLVSYIIQKITNQPIENKLNNKQSIIDMSA